MPDAAVHLVADQLVAGDLLDVFTAGATLGLIYLIVATSFILAYRRNDRLSPVSAEPVTVLRPLHGAEPRLHNRLATLCNQAYPAPVQIIFGCQDGEDPAIEAVKALRRDRPELDLELVVEARLCGHNRKVSNLINMFIAARHDVVAVSDSDIEVGSDYLNKITAALEEDGVGAVTCLYHGEAGDTLAAWLSALAINAHFLPNVVVGIGLNLAQPCFGSTIAMRRETLERIGGFRSFADKLADDYAIGQAVRAVGLHVAIPSFTLGHVCYERTIAEFFRHQLRSARTIRSLDPFGYAGAFIGNPLPLALIGFLHGGAEAGALAGAVLTLRLALCKATERKFDLPPQRLWLVPATDVLLFAVYICSFFGAAVSWRGRRYRVVSDGTLSHDRRRAST
jgi:ceramide glucosyltransferase